MEYQSRGVANVLDNQVVGLHRRDVSENASPKRRFWYALRAPNQRAASSVAQQVSCTRDGQCQAGATVGDARNVCSNEGSCIDGCHSDEDCATGDQCVHSLPHWTCDGATEWSP